LLNNIFSCIDILTGSFCSDNGKTARISTGCFKNNSAFVNQKTIINVKFFLAIDSDRLALSNF